MDRIDLQLDVRRLSPESVLSSGEGTSSEVLRAGVMRARAFAAWRRAHAREQGLHACEPGLGNVAGSSRAAPDVTAEEGCAREAPRAKGGSRSPREVIESCQLTDEARSFLVSMAQAYSMSGRALVSSLGVARTIADLEEREAVGADHLAEALGFRLRNGIGGM